MSLVLRHGSVVKTVETDQTMPNVEVRIMSIFSSNNYHRPPDGLLAVRTSPGSVTGDGGYFSASWSQAELAPPPAPCGRLGSDCDISQDRNITTTWSYQSSSLHFLCLSTTTLWIMDLFMTTGNSVPHYQHQHLRLSTQGFLLEVQLKNVLLVLLVCYSNV